MVWEWSTFGRRLGGGSGIGELMADLGEALASGGDRVRMLGGGQPAHIPEMDALWRKRIEQIDAEPGGLEHMLGNYEPPAGNSCLSGVTGRSVSTGVWLGNWTGKRGSHRWRAISFFPHVQCSRRAI